MDKRDLHVVFGTGPLGMAVARELVSRGRRVRVVNRSGSAQVPAGVEIAKADATDQESVRRACEGAAVVYNCTNAPYTEWPDKFPAIWRGVLEGAASVGARLVCGDNLYMYGRVSGPIREDLPYGATGRKGRTRAGMAQMVLEAHRSGKVRATIGRAADFYGPRALDSAVGEMVFGAALAGKAANVLGNPDAPHTYTFIDDFGRGLVTLGEHDEAFGQVWHIPNAPTVTTRQFIEMVFEETGQPVKLRVAPRFLVTALGLVNPLFRELKEMLYEFEEPFVVDHDKFERAFGASPTPHREGIRQTVAWYRERLRSREIAAVTSAA